MSAPKYQPHYTFADYCQWEGDWELWSGAAVAMTPSPFGTHQRILTRLARMFGNQLEVAGRDCEVVVELDWIVAEDTVVRPDLMIICEDFPDRHLLSAPSLIAEVLSDATRNKDLTNKKQLYRENGVQYYLIADPQHASLQLFYRPAFGDAYREIRDEQPKVVFADGCRFHCQFNSIFQT